MTRYPELTDDKLNKLVAERQGYYTVANVNGGSYWGFYNASGQLLCLSKNEAELTQNITSKGHVANWASDLNAAAALDFGVALVTIVTQSGCKAEVEVIHKGQALFVEHNIEARARTIAWLMYRDAIAADS